MEDAGAGEGVHVFRPAARESDRVVQTGRELTNAQLSVVEHPSDEANLAALGRGRIDVAIVDKATARFLLATKLPVFMDKVAALEPPVEVWPMYVAISKKTAEPDQLLADFNRGLAQLHERGRIHWILKKHGLR